MATHRITSGYKCWTSTKPKKILNFGVFALREVIGLWESWGSVYTCRGKRSINHRHQIPYECLLPLKDFSSTTKPICLLGDQSNGFMLLLVAIPRVRRCPQRRLHPKLWHLQILPPAVSMMWYLHMSNSFVPKEEQSAYLLLLQCLWVNLSTKCEYTQAGNSILISEFVIFSSFIIPFQIIPILFLWCIKLVHC